MSAEEGKREWCLVSVKLISICCQLFDNDEFNWLNKYSVDILIKGILPVVTSKEQ